MSGRRLPIAIVLVGLLVAAAVVGDGRVVAGTGASEPNRAATMPTAGMRSSAWYCAGGPVGRGPSGDRVTISNVGSRSVPAAVDVMVAGRAVSERLITVAARSSTTLAVGLLSRAPSAAVVVQPLGPDVVVEQGFSSRGDVAMTPCATRAASTWYFAAGSTVGGAAQFISILDPFAVDAVVDIEGYTENGFRAPGSLQGLVVAQRSRLLVRIDRAIAEQKMVAIAVRVRNGSNVVATQVLTRVRSAALTDASMSLGAVAPDRTWIFADNRSRAGATQQLVIAAPGDTDATARVSVVADVDAVIEQRVVQVPATSAAVVDFTGVIPAGVAYTLVVQSTVPVVAETRATFDPARSDLTGALTEVGSPVAARQWWFAGGPFAATGLGAARPRVPSGSDFVVVMKVDATESDIGHVRAALAHDSHVRSFTTVTPAAARAQLLRANRDNPVLVAKYTNVKVPLSFDVAVIRQASIAELRTSFGKRAGVDHVLSRANEGPHVIDDIVVSNPGRYTVRVSLVASANGAILAGEAMRDVAVAPGHQVTISLLALAQKGAAVVVTAGGPVVAERFVAGPWGVTRAPGVPS